jgi:transposase
MALVGLDVHQAQTVAAVLDRVTGELDVKRLRGAPGDVVPVFLEQLGRPVRAVYEAGPTGFTLARAATARGLDLRVIAPGSIPRAPGDRVKTDRRDARRLVRLFAAGELSFAWVPSEADERFRDLVRCIDDARKDLMRARHRLSKFLLRCGLRFGARQWTQPHQRWLGSLTFDDALSRTVFIDYCCAVDAVAHRRRTLIAVLEDAVAASSHAETVARLRCFRGINTLTAAGLCAEVGSFERFAKPALLSGFLGIVPCEYTSDQKRVQGQITKAGPTHARRLLVEAAHHYGAVRASARSSAPATTARTHASSESRGARSGACISAGRTSARHAASRPEPSRSPARASSRRSAGRPRPWTDPFINIQPRAAGGCRGAHE